MLKRLLVAAILIAIAVFCVIYLIRYQFKAPVKKAEALSREAVAQGVFAGLVKKHNAIDSWDKELCQGQPARTTPILTMDLEKLWLTGRPILFVGKILDIKTEDKANYRIIVDRDVFLAASVSRPVLRTDLQAAVLCPKSVIESFIAANPDYLDAGNGVALIAKVEAIESMEATGKDEAGGSGKIGKGNCLDLVCLRTH